MDALRFDRHSRLLAQRTSRRRAGQVLGSLAAAGAFSSTLAPHSVSAVRQSAAACPHGSGLIAWGPQHGFAQTFTPTVAGKISEVQILVDHSFDATKDYVIKILPVNSSGTPIATRTLAKTVVTIAELGGGDQWLIAKFKKRRAAKVMTDKAYAIFLQGDPDELRVIARNQDPCAGNAFIYDQDSGEFTLVTGNDLIFEVFVGYE